MWLISLLPNWIFHAALIAGILALVVTTVLKAGPLPSIYLLPIQIGAMCLVVIGVWFEGAISNQETWEAKVKEVEAKVAAAGVKSAEENTKIVTKVVKQREIVRTRGEDIVKYVDREVVKYDNTCTIPEAVIRSHNAAATNTAIIENNNLMQKSK